MNFDIREDNEGNVFVEDLSWCQLALLKEAMDMIKQGTDLHVRMKPA